MFGNTIAYLKHIWGMTKDNWIKLIHRIPFNNIKKFFSFNLKWLIIIFVIFLIIFVYKYFFEGEFFGMVERTVSIDLGSHIRYVTHEAVDWPVFPVFKILIYILLFSSLMEKIYMFIFFRTQRGLGIYSSLWRCIILGFGRSLLEAIAIILLGFGILYVVSYLIAFVLMLIPGLIGLIIGKFEVIKEKVVDVGAYVALIIFLPIIFLAIFAFLFLRYPAISKVMSYLNN